MAVGAARVHDAAVKLFADKGFHGTGIRDLAEAAGLRSASLYHYMGTKQELLATVMRTALDRLVAAADAVTADVADPRQRLANLVALHVLTHARRPAETRVVDHEVHALTDAARADIVTRRDAYESRWTAAITAGLATGALHTEAPAVTRLALLEMCSGVARWYSPDGDLGLDQLATHYARLALRALGCAYDTARPPEVARCHAVLARFWPE